MLVDGVTSTSVLPGLYVQTNEDGETPGTSNNLGVPEGRVIEDEVEISDAAYEAAVLLAQQSVPELAGIREFGSKNRKSVLFSSSNILLHNKKYPFTTATAGILTLRPEEFVRGPYTYFGNSHH